MLRYIQRAINDAGITQYNGARDKKKGATRMIEKKRVARFPLCASNISSSPSLLTKATFNCAVRFRSSTTLPLLLDVTETEGGEKKIVFSILKAHALGTP